MANGSAWSVKSAFSTATGMGYIKYPDGTMIQWGIWRGTVTYSAWGSIYESSVISLGDFPIAFVGQTPVVTISPNNSGSSVMGVSGTSPSLTSLGGCRVYRPNNPVSTYDITLGWIAIGRWKV